MQPTDATPRYTGGTRDGFWDHYVAHIRAKARGVHHDVLASLRILQLEEAEAWQAQFTPVRNADGNDVVPPMRNTQWFVIARGQEV